MNPHVRITTLFRHAAILSMALLMVSTTTRATLAQDLAQHRQQAVEVEAVQPTQHINFASKSALWKATLEVQLISLLDSNIPNIRVQALQHIIFLSSMYPEDFVFVKAVPQLLSFYEDQQADEAFRMMALAALHATANDKAMARLQMIVEREPSHRLRKLTKAVLRDYFERPLPL